MIAFILRHFRRPPTPVDRRRVVYEVIADYLAADGELTDPLKTFLTWLTAPPDGHA